MANRSKAKGTAAETRVVNFFLEHGVDARRVVMKGQRDEGDIHFFGWRQGTLEVKSGKQTQHVSRQQKTDWLAEARKEGLAADHVPYLVIAVHGSAVKDYHVWSATGAYFFYLDEFVEWVRSKGGS